MRLERLHQVPNIQVHYADPHRCIGSRGLRVLTSEDGGHDWRNAATLPAALSTRLANRFDLPRRLLRGGIHLIQPRVDAAGDPTSEWIAVACRTVFAVNLDTGATQALYHIPRGRRPLRHGLWVGADSLLIGEYWGNPERESVHIYRVRLDTRQVESAYQFEAGAIRHVHTVQWDPYGERFWVSTGDSDPECQVLLLDRTGTQVETVGQGSQQWRAVSFVFTPQAVYWGTDNHLGLNQIWRFDRTSGVTESLGDVIGPVYYSTRLDDYMLFGTTVEKGEGDQDHFGRLYAVDRAQNVQEIWRQPKDRWSPHYFGYGVFEFPEGRLEGNRFWITCKGFRSGFRSVLMEVHS